LLCHLSRRAGTMLYQPLSFWICDRWLGFLTARF
jgi:hypothetical protein